MQKPIFLSIKISFIETFESWMLGISLAILALGIGITVFFFHVTKDTFYQGIIVDNMAIGGLTKQEALTKLTNQQSHIANVPITVSVDDIIIASQSGQLGVTKNYNSVLNQAFEVGRAGFPLSRIATILRLSFTAQEFATPYQVDETKVATLVAQLAAQTDELGEVPSAELELSGVPSSLVIFPGHIGRAVDQPTTTSLISQAIAGQTQLQEVAVPAVVASTAAKLSEEEVAAAQERANLFIGKKAKFTANEVKISLNDQALIEFLAFPTGYKPASPTLLDNWAKRVNREPQEPIFEYNSDTLAVTAFSPPRDGLALDPATVEQVLTTALSTIETTAQTPAQTETEVQDEFTFDLPVKIKPPRKSLADTNNLGIKEVIGIGESEYDHSIPSRIHNVALATTKITNHILAPGEEFSFNKTLGDVSSRTGFQPAYVIQGGRTVLGDGGGVCQVSTTLFRAVLNAGLHVTKRKQHSYRVSYYELNEKPGVDATVYSGDVDLRFVNDTDDYILIHSQADSDDLYMYVELYGTSDGRTAEIVDHKVWDYRSPPAPVYTNDPSLPPGAVKQVDWAVSGVKTQFTNVIKDKDGNVIRQDEYYSNYIPWSAKYLRGV